MRSSKQPPMKNTYSNDYQTPPKALNPLLPFLKKEWVIWECAEGQGHLSSELKKYFTVIGTELYRDGTDFLKDKPSQFDCIITNPPFSQKQRFLERCYELGKPFALLLPLTTFETKKRQDLFKKHGVQVIFFDKRINFFTPSGDGIGSWFATAWFTWGLNLPKDMVFTNLEQVKEAEKLDNWC